MEQERLRVSLRGPARPDSHPRTPLSDGAVGRPVTLLAGSDAADPLSKYCRSARLPARWARAEA